MGPINWAGRTAQIEVTLNTVQEGHPAISDAVVEKRTKARGPAGQDGTVKVMRTLTMAYDIEQWMQRVEEDVLKVEVRNGKTISHRPEWRNAHLLHAG